MTTPTLIEAAFREGIKVGQVAEVQFIDDGVTPVRIRPIRDFLHDWDYALTGRLAWDVLLGRDDEEWGNFSPRSDRAYLGVIHVDGAYMVEL